MTGYIDPEFRVIGDIKFLPPPELKVAIESDNRSELFVAGYYDYDAQQLMLFRGDGTSLIVPSSFFILSAKSPLDFNQFNLTDYGQTIKLGDYAVSANSILSEFDLSYGNNSNENSSGKRTKVFN